jgi:acetyl-CoA acyltransferase
MGADCERLAARYGVTRQEQDEFAVRSHRLAAQAWEEDRLNAEVCPVRVPPGFREIARDNGFRADTSLAQLARLKPAFVKPYGNVTAGNSSFLTDGAAVALIGTESACRRLGRRPEIAIRDWVFTAQSPDDSLLLGPATALPKLLDRNQLALPQIDVFEFHEAFAGQVAANLKCLADPEFNWARLGRSEAVGEVPLDRLNRWGGSLSLGHPFGATGARLVTTTARRLIAEEGRWGVTASCAAGGLGSAILLERME